MTSAFHFGGSVTLKTTVGTDRTSLQTAVSDDSSLTALSHNNISLLLCVVVVVFLWLLIYCVLSLQLSLSAGQANSSVVQASAPTRPTSVMETMIARTTLMRPTAVHTHTHTPTIYLTAFKNVFLGVAITSRILCYLPFVFPDIHVCLPSQFKCTHPSRCIPGIFRCNGQDNCGEGEDEKDCRESNCPSSSL